jgi:4-aminobutyrate aminotransferase-like enzyme
MMIGIEIADPGSLAPRPDVAKRVLGEALARNLLLLTCGTFGQVIRVIPPLVTTDAEMDQAIEIIGAALEAAT